jgi:hypothetical protein
MARIDLPDGRSLELRPMYISDKLAIVALDAEDPPRAFLARMEAYAAILERAVTWRSWDGPLTDMTEQRLLAILREWAVLTEDDALPPASGTGSEMTSPAPDSAPVAGSPSHSATPSSASLAPGASRPGRSSTLSGRRPRPR